MKLKKLRVLSAALAASMILDMTGMQVLAQEAMPNAAAAEENITSDDTAEEEAGIPENDENASVEGNQIGGEGQEESEGEKPEGQEESEEEKPEGQEESEEEKPEGQEESEEEKPEGQEESEEEKPEGQEESEEEKPEGQEESDEEEPEEKEADEAEETVSENSVSENDLEEDENAGDFDMFPGLGHKLSAAQMADKRTLSAHVGDTISDQNIKNDYKDAEGVYAPGVIVYTTDSQEEAEEVAAAFGGDLESYFCGVAVIDLAEGVTVARAVCAAASEETNLPAVWPDYKAHLLNEEDAEETSDEYSSEEYSSYYQAAAAANDPALSETSEDYQWMHEYIGDSYAWAAGYKGQGIKVAVIDSGVRASHEDLAPNIQDGWDCTGSTLTSFGGDRDEHGTHVAGIIAAQENNGKGGAGIAPDATITGFCVQDTDGIMYDSYIMRAINAAVEKGYDIINMSLGSAWYEDNYAEVIKDAYEAGVAVFAASGNESTNASSFPAAYPGVISVGAVDQNSAKAGFTNYGPTVDVSFPGVDIFSTVSSSDTAYAFMDGTSMACPAAAGTAAVILSADATIRNKSGKGRVDALLSAMKKSTTKCSASGMGAGTTYLPGVLGIATTQTALTAPTITIDETSYVAKEKAYRAESVTVTISANIPEGVKIYYSLGSKKPSYKNGEVINGTELSVTSNLTQCTGTVVLTGAKKVTVNAIAVNTITGKASKAASKTVTLAPAPTGVTITQANGITQIAKGKKVVLKAEVTPSYAVSAKVEWTVDDAAKAAGITVKNGTVAAKKTTAAGTYTITATAVGNDGKNYNGERGTYQITVLESASVKRVTLLKKDTLDLVTKKSADLSESLEVVKADGSKGSAADVVWSSSNTKIVVVDKNGKITAKAAGKANITAMANDGSGKKAACAITVTSPVTNVAISGPAKVAAGKSITLTAAVTPAAATNKKLNWKVEGNDKVTVKNGKVTARKGAEGICTVYAEAQDGSGTKSAGYKVTIVSGAITRITLNSTSISLFNAKGTSQTAIEATLTATVKGNMGADLTAVQFTSSAPKIAAVTQNGATATIVAKTAGKATITCMAADGSGKKATCKVTVNVPMSKLSVSPANDGYFGYVAQGKSISLVAKYSDVYGEPTNKKIKWSSANEEYVTVNPSNGKVTAKKNAPIETQVKITATAADGSGVQGSYVVTVMRAYSQVVIEDAEDRLGEDTDAMLVAFPKKSINSKQYLMGFADYLDVQVSGGKNTGCQIDYVKTKTPDGRDFKWCTITPILNTPTCKETYEELENKYYKKVNGNGGWYIPANLMQKVKVTVKLKDGSNLKQSKTVPMVLTSDGMMLWFK